MTVTGDSLPRSTWRRRALRAGLGCAVLLPLFVGGIWLRLYLGVSPAAPGEALPAEAALPHDGGAFPKQGPNECGAYSLALGLRLATPETPDPGAVVREVSQHFAWSTGLSGTRPWRLSSALERRGLKGEGFSCASLPAPQRLGALQRWLAAGRPTIVLIESERGTLHYVLALGYGAEGVDIYDPAADADPESPGCTLDLNGARPGNRTLPAARFLELWARGGLLGLYRWWCLPLRHS